MITATMQGSTQEQQPDMAGMESGGSDWTACGRTDQGVDFTDDFEVGLILKLALIKATLPIKAQFNSTSSVLFELTKQTGQRNVALR